MKLNILRNFAAAGMVAVFLFNSITVNAEPATDLKKGHATAYCLKGTTASGEQTRDGICAGKREWLGKTIILYSRLPDDSVGGVIGIYECKDTGGTKGLKTGKVIDVWCSDLSSCQEFMDRVYEDDCKGRVYIQVVED